MSRESTQGHAVELLKELVKWTRFQGILKAKEVLLDTLKSNSERLVYVLSDGRGSQEVGKAAGISHTTVVSYWNKWATLGIVEPLRVKGGTRYKSVFSLGYFGIEVPAGSPSAKSPSQGGSKIDDGESS